MTIKKLAVLLAALALIGIGVGSKVVAEPRTPCDNPPCAIDTPASPY